MLDSVDGQMIARTHRENHLSKLLEIQALLRSQRVLLEEWDDARAEMLQTPNSVSHSLGVVGSYDTTTEECLECVQELHIALVLHDGELRKDLNLSCHVGSDVDSDVKASFTIHETCDPICDEFHWLIPNVKSLRVPCSIRAFPADCPHVRLIFTDRDKRSSTERL